MGLLGLHQTTNRKTLRPCFVIPTLDSQYKYITICETYHDIVTFFTFKGDFLLIRKPDLTLSLENRGLWMPVMKSGLRDLENPASRTIQERESEIRLANSPTDKGQDDGRKQNHRYRIPEDFLGCGLTGK